MIVQLHDFPHGHSHSHGEKPKSSAKNQLTSSQTQGQTITDEHNNIEETGNPSTGNSNVNSNQIATVSSTNDALRKQNETYAVNIGPDVENKMKDSHQEENLNVRAAIIHVAGDILQSVGVFIAALIVYFKPDYAIADPICTLLFSVIVLVTTINILRDALMVLMEGTPSYLDYAEVLEIFQQIDGVERVHNLRIWALSVSKVALSVHLAIRHDANPTNILRKAHTAVHQKYNFFETTIQIEEVTPDMDNCQQCTIPEK